ncbi:MAG: S41 family peptidase [Bacillota bacterium]|nr:S41 family peptidase [Bacillota bacterium]
MNNRTKPRHRRTILMIFLAIALLLTPLAVSALPAAEPISASDQAVIRRVILENYVVELDPARLETITVESLEKLLDENSYYLPPWAMKAFMDEYNGEFEGIGAYIMEQRGSIIIAEPMPGSPAEAAGLRPGDMIVSVDGTSMAGLSVDDAVRLIKGPAGTDVTLVIRRSGVTDLMTFTINRRQITVTSIRTQTFDDDIGYLNVQQFTDHTAENAQFAVDNFRAAGIDKLIIDLRGNPGGLLTEGVEFSRLFIPRGPIVHILYRDGMTTYSSYLGEDPFHTIVVLVDENTASAAEIFTAAFRDRNVGIIVGESTYGKGSVQRLYTLPSGAGFKLTEAVYVSPDYATIDRVGIAPSINMLRFHPDNDPEDLLPLDITRKPGLGSRGDDVAAAQQRLDHMGYRITDTSGFFGTSTFDAVRQFQADQRVFPYGVLDFSTQRRLQSAYMRWLLAPEQDLQLSTALYYLRGHRSSHENVTPIPYGGVQLP